MLPKLMPTLLDVAKRLDSKGKIDKIVELLNLSNQILTDMVWLECNDGTGHRTTVRKGIPLGTWRKLNYGVQNTKSDTAQIKDACGMLEAYAEVDKALVDVNNNAADFRLTEDMAHIEGMNQQMMRTLFYGDTAVDPEKFMGLSSRYNAKSTSKTKSGYNVVDGKSSTQNVNTSVWLVCWGPTTVHGIYPQGSQAGLRYTDLGEQTLFDNQTPPGKFQGYRSHYKWDCGLTVRDWRYVVRIANINVSQLSKDASTGLDLIDAFIDAVEKLPAISMGRHVFYANETITSYLRRQISRRDNVYLSLDEVAGKKVVSFDGIPVRKVDSTILLNTEALVS